MTPPSRSRRWTCPPLHASTVDRVGFGDIRPQRPVRAMAVVVINEDAKNPLEMVAIQNQEPVETLRADGPHEPLRHPVGLWGTKRRAKDLDAVTAKHLVKTGREFLVSIANQEANRFRALGHVQVSCRACWVTQGELGFDEQPARCTRRLPNSMKKSTYSRCSQIVSTVKKSTASRLSRCVRMNSRHVIPRVCRPVRARRPQPGTDRRRGDRHAQPLQLADNPLISPPGVLSSQTKHQVSNLTVLRWASNWVRIGPPFRHQPAMPSQQCCPA